MLIFAPIGFARTRLLIGGGTRLPEAGTKTKDQKEYQSIISVSLQISRGNEFNENYFNFNVCEKVFPIVPFFFFFIFFSSRPMSPSALSRFYLISYKIYCANYKVDKTAYPLGLFQLPNPKEPMFKNAFCFSNNFFYFVWTLGDWSLGLFKTTSLLPSFHGSSTRNFVFFMV